MEFKRIYEKALKSTFAEQWKRVITVDDFSEFDAILPGIIKENDGRKIEAVNVIISNGSKIFVPENTTAIILNNGEIENVLDYPGGYEVKDGESSLFNNEGFFKSIVERVANKLEFKGESVNKKSIVFVNRREIRNIAFGLETPLSFHDAFYEIDLELYSYGSFSVKIVDPFAFVTNYIPANTYKCDLNDKKANKQLIAEFIQAYRESLSNFSGKCKYSELQSKISEINQQIIENLTILTWKERFGLELTKTAIGNITLSDDSRKIINSYAKKKTDISAYANASEKTSNIAAQQKIAEAIKNSNLENAESVIVATTLTQLLNNDKKKNTISIDDQLTLLKKLKEAKDSGIINDEEYEKKKKEILDL